MRACRNSAFVKLDRDGNELDDAAFWRALTSCMPIRELIRRVVCESDETLDDNAVTSVSSACNERVERSASFRRSAFNEDLAIIAAHHDKLTAAKFNNIATHVDTSVENMLVARGKRVDNTPSPPSRPPLPLQLHPVILGMPIGQCHKTLQVVI